MKTDNPLTFLVHDTSLVVRSTGKEKDSSGRIMPDNKTYKGINAELAKLGFDVGKDPRIERHFPILSSTHNAGRHGDLQFVSEVYPAGCKFEFFQELVYENSNGGRYDFDKLTKMPYLVRLRWQHTINALREYLIGRGFEEIIKIRSPNPDPLAYFNSSWDGEYEIKRGIHRFARGPDGWPLDKELASWGRKDATGVILNHGDVRYFRDRKGHLMRGRVYGGINGMWMVVYGPGLNDYTHMHAGELFTCKPTEVPRKSYPRPESVWTRLKNSAVKNEDYEKAIVYRNLIDLRQKCA